MPYKFSLRVPLLFQIAVVMMPLATVAVPLQAQNAQRTPSDVVREFYKAMREHRFKDAWVLTIYKPAVEDLTAEEMEDLRTTFEGKAAQVPEQVEITGEQINGNVATVFVKVPATDASPQITSQPASLILSNGNWIIGTEADAAIVKKAGRRYFLDALINENQGAVEDFLKSLVGVQAIYAQQHNGAFGDFPALIKAGLISDDAADPKATGYNLRLILSSDAKNFTVAGEPARYGHTGKLSYWMDQTGNLRNVDNGGKPLGPPK
jgi:hypothetical protein